MSDHNAGTLAVLAIQVSRFFGPVRDRLENGLWVEFFADLGLTFPPELSSNPTFVAAVSTSLSSLQKLPKLIQRLLAAIAAGEFTKALQAVADLQAGIQAALNALVAVSNALGSVGGSLPGMSPADVAAFVNGLGGRLFDWSAITYVEESLPELAGLLDFFGVFERVEQRVGSSHPTKPPFTQKTLHLDKLPRAIFAPLGALQDLYGFGHAGFDGLALLSRLAGILTQGGIPAVLDHGVVPPTLDALFLKIARTNATSPPALAITFKVPLSDQDELSLPPVKIARKLILSPAGATLTFNPDLSLSLSAPALSTTAGQLSVQVDVSEPNPPIVLLGAARGSRLEVHGVSTAAAASLTWDAGTSSAKGALEVEATLHNVHLLVEPPGDDGFLAKIFPSEGIDSTFDIGFVLGASGVRFQGGGGLNLQLHPHLSLGAIRVDEVDVRLVLSAGSSGLHAELALTIAGSLGPLEFSVQGIGIDTDLSFTKGNLGPANLDFGFMSPTGVGLSLDAGGFKGGGFLRFDAANGEYAGVLELDFNGLFSVKAIAIINTKMPDGSPGFSLLVLITAEFTPIQLGFGFTLNGVGGLFALNRTIFVNALVEGIRTNAIASILFPQDVIANITRIISDIKQFFPPQEGHFVVGPMGKLGWGTPTIITAELGLLLDLPMPMFAIIGILRAVLPAEEAAILKLQVNFIGVLDFDRGYLFFRADLFDSRLLLFTITGSLAFLVSWGEEQLFALSVGGFHPDFHDIPTIPALPDGFRNMARIGISLLSDDNPRLKVESYFAVTSNTVQFGAKVELYAGAASFNIYGFLGYDVLFQFDPFAFVAALYGGVALRQGDNVIAGIGVAARLAGPTPWDARGTASLTILFFEISVGFHVSWGDPPPAIDQKTEDLLDLLKRQLADTRNWHAELPPENHLHVSLRTIVPLTTGEVPLVIHPAGVLTFSERTLPLGGYLIEKLGTRKPLADNKFTLSDANAGGLAIPADYQGVREQFAISQFSELSDSEKLSRRSFESLPSGFSLTGTSNLQATLPVTRDVTYELSYLRRKPTRIEFSGIVRLALRAYDRLVKGSAVRQSALAKQQTRPSLNAPPQVTLPAEQFTVANVADLTGYAATGESVRIFRTEAEAYQHQKELIRSNPALAGQIQIVSQFELAS